MGLLVFSSNEDPVIMASKCFCSEVLSSSESSQSICFLAFFANSCILWAFSAFLISSPSLYSSAGSSIFSDSKTCTRELNFLMGSVWLLFCSLGLRLGWVSSSFFCYVSWGY